MDDLWDTDAVAKHWIPLQYKRVFGFRQPQCKDIRHIYYSCQWGLMYWEDGIFILKQSPRECYRLNQFVTAVRRILVGDLKRQNVPYILKCKSLCIALGMWTISIGHYKGTNVVSAFFVVLQTPTPHNRQRVELKYKMLWTSVGSQQSQLIQRYLTSITSNFTIICGLFF